MSKRKKEKSLYKSWWVITLFIFVGIIILFTLLSIPYSNTKESYLNSMSDLNGEMGDTLQKLSSTTNKIGDGEITPEQSIELYEIYKSQLQEVKNKMDLLIPYEGFESMHQHHLNGINLYIESCDLTIKGLNENNASILDEASSKVMEGTTEISTAIELIISKH